MRPILLIAVLLLPTLALGGIVELRPAATVTGRYVRLGDVADVDGATAEEIERLETAILGPAPVPGRTVVLDDASIRARLRAIGIPLGRVEFNGRSRVVVQAAAPKPKPTQPAARPTPKPLPSPKPTAKTPRPATPRPVLDWHRKRATELVETAFRGHLENHAPVLGRVAIEAIVPPEQMLRVIESRPTGYEFAIPRDAEDWERGVVVGVRFLDREQKLVEMPVRFRVTPLPSVVVATRTLTTGHVVRAADIEFRQVDEVGDGFTDPRELLDRETTRTIQAGRAIKRGEIRVVPLVRRNDVITLVSRAGGIAVTSLAKARADGARGETISVITLDGRHNLVARVTAFHEAEVVTAKTEPTNEAVRFRTDEGNAREGGVDRRVTSKPRTSVRAELANTRGGFRQ